MSVSGRPSESLMMTRSSPTTVSPPGVLRSWVSYDCLPERTSTMMELGGGVSVAAGAGFAATLGTGLELGVGGTAVVRVKVLRVVVRSASVALTVT